MNAHRLFCGLTRMAARAPRYDDEQLGVNFFRTQLADARLEGLTLSRTFFGRSEIRGVSFRGTDLSQFPAAMLNWTAQRLKMGTWTHASTGLVQVREHAKRKQF